MTNLWTFDGHSTEPHGWGVTGVCVHTRFTKRALLAIAAERQLGHWSELRLEFGSPRGWYEDQQAERTGVFQPDMYDEDGLTWTVSGGWCRWTRPTLPTRVGRR